MKNLFALAMPNSNKPYVDHEGKPMYFGDKQQAKKKRDVLNRKGLALRVIVGPDHIYYQGK